MLFRSKMLCVQVLRELTVIAPDTTVNELTAAALRASIGDLCMHHNRAAIAALAGNVGMTVPGVVRTYIALILSRGFWQGAMDEPSLMQLVSGMILFVESLLLEDTTESARLLTPCSGLYCRFDLLPAHIRLSVLNQRT
jgi:hypothetical protein